MERARFILLLVSSDFIESDFCYAIEARRAIERQQAGEAEVVPVILRPVAWQITELGRFQALPKDARPITEWSLPDAAYLNISEGIVNAVIKQKTGTMAALAGDDARKGPATSRVLDAGLPETVTVGESVLVVVLVRRPASPGLRAVVECDAAYGLREWDIRSSGAVRIDFPIDLDGKVSEAILTVQLETLDFQLETRSKPVIVPPTATPTP